MNSLSTTRKKPVFFNTPARQSKQVSHWFSEFSKIIYGHTQQPLSAPATEHEVVPDPYSLPPGLMGDIAKFIYDAAPRPVREIALAGAIGLMAGIAGRAYNISGTGLNQYVLLLAGTGRGKEAAASGIDRIMHAIKTEMPCAPQFIGPAEIASGQALLKYLSNTTTCFLSIIGEFGWRMQQLSASKNSSAEIMLKRVLLDLYSKSGTGKVLKPFIYSQKENNTSIITSPSVSLMGESTPETFYSAINETMIADGLLPRFLMIEYDGKRQKLNPDHEKVKPSAALKKNLIDLITNCLNVIKLMDANGSAIKVQLDAEAQKISDAFNDYADEQINNSTNNVTQELWNRAHIQLLKLAALVAVGVSLHQPIITADHVNWAANIIYYNINKLITHFEKGEIGSNNDEVKQQAEVKRMIKEYILSDEPTKVRSYKVPSDIAKEKFVITKRYLSNRTANLSIFKHDKIRATAALNRTIKNLIDTGFISEIGKHQMREKFNTDQQAFVVMDAASILAD